MAAIKPHWPPSNELGYFPYLGSEEIGHDVLSRCCIKEAEVVGIDSLKTVTVRYNDTDYPNTPIYVQTDIGARARLMTEVEAEDPADYFADAALMFPLTGGVDVGSTTLDPIALVAVQDGEVIAVVGVKQSITREYPSQFPTYRPYMLVTVNILEDITVVISTVKMLYDALNDSVAMIPTYDGSAVPGLPLLTAKGTDDTTLNGHISDFLSSATMPLFAAEFSRYPRGVHSPGPRSVTDFPNTYYEGGTWAQSYPAWNIDGYEGGTDPDYQRVTSATVIVPGMSGSVSLPGTEGWTYPAGIGDLFVYTESVNPLATNQEAYLAGMWNLSDVTGDMQLGSWDIEFDDGVTISRDVNNYYSLNVEIFGQIPQVSGLYRDGSAVTTIKFTAPDDYTTQETFTLSYHNNAGNPRDSRAVGTEAHAGAYGQGFTYSPHLSFFGMWTCDVLTDYTNSNFQWTLLEATKDNSLVRSTGLSDAVASCISDIESTFYATETTLRRTLEIDFTLYLVPYDTRLAALQG